MRVVAAMMVLALGWASPARAQQKELLPPWVVDVRGVFAKLGQDEVTAADLGIAATALPGTAIGAAIGVNVYPLRRQKLSLGIGGEGLLSRAVSTPTDAAGTVTGARVERRFQGISGTVSLNFGHRQGWSYVSGGLGPVRFQTFSGDLPLEAPPFELTENFGAGARWFTNQHVAFCFDLRFYLTKPEPATAISPGRGRERVMVIGAGIAIK